jgi:chaperone modulatory protein CbpM
MILNREQFIAQANLDQATLEIWIEEEWLIPGGDSTQQTFSEADLARAELIRDLMDDLGVNHEGVGIVLRLVDQVHGLRGALANMIDLNRAR